MRESLKVHIALGLPQERWLCKRDFDGTFDRFYWGGFFGISVQMSLRDVYG